MSTNLPDYDAACSRCGVVQPGGPPFCGSCGAPMLKESPQELQDQPATAEQTSSPGVEPVESLTRSRRGLRIFSRTLPWIAAAVFMILFLAYPQHTTTTKVVRIPRFIVTSTPPSWEVGACVGLSANGQDVFPVHCGQPHFGVVVSEVTSRYDCPYFTNYTSTYSPEASTVTQGSQVFCYVHSNVSNP